MSCYFLYFLLCECLAVCLVSAVNIGSSGEIWIVLVSSGQDLSPVISADEISTTGLRVYVLTCLDASRGSRNIQISPCRRAVARPIGGKEPALWPITGQEIILRHPNIGILLISSEPPGYNQQTRILSHSHRPPSLPQRIHREKHK